MVSWEEIGKLTTLPPNAPARCSGNHLGWLVELSRDKDEGDEGSAPVPAPSPAPVQPPAATVTEPELESV